MKKFATVVFLLCLVSASQSQWLETAAFPGGPTDGCYSFTINNETYVGGGLVPHKLYQYKPDGSWVSLGTAAAGGERGWAFSFTIGNKAYVCGGANGGPSNLTKDLWEFDATTRTWTQKADMPEKRDGGFAFSVGGKGYVGCGFDGTYMVSDFYSYDPYTDTWQTLNPYPEALIFPSAFVVNDKAYVVGGAGATETASLYRYEADKDEWTKLRDFPGDVRQAATAFALGNAGYYAGGMQGYTTNFRDIWKYDVATDTWSNTGVEMPDDYTAWQTATAGPVNDMPGWVVFAGGASLSGGELKMTAKTFRFTPGQADVAQPDKSTTSILYPNPLAQGEAFTYTGNLPVTFTVTDLLGRRVMHGVTENSRIDCAGLTPGCYMISFNDGVTAATSRLVVK